MNRMRIFRAMFVLTLLILPAGVASAQEAQPAAAAEESKEGIRPNSLYPGSWSLQFQITEDIGLKPFNGMIVSVKRHFSERSALRLGLRFDVDWEDERGSHLVEVADTAYDWYDVSMDRDYQNFTIDLTYLRYVSPGSYVNLFWGIGPLVSFSRSERTSGGTDDYFARSTREYARSWNIGPLGLIGVEWFLSKHFSFHSEYRAAITYGESMTEQERIELTSSTTRVYFDRNEGNRWDFQSVYVILGLSVYF